MSTVSDPQGRRVGVDPIGYHAVVHRPASRDAVTGQQTHDAGVPVVELDHSDRRKGRHANKPVEAFPFSLSCGRRDSRAAWR